jgi:hypothetical protein
MGDDPQTASREILHFLAAPIEVSKSRHEGKDNAQNDPNEKALRESPLFGADWSAQKAGAPADDLHSVRFSTF